MASDPAAAGDWLTRFPPGTAQDDALETLMTFWKALNSEEASRWASQLSDPALRGKIQSLLAKPATDTP